MAEPSPPSPEANSPEAEEALVAVVPGAPPPSEGRLPREEGRFWDMMIFMLAGAILALSAVGLYLLLASS